MNSLPSSLELFSSSLSLTNLPSRKSWSGSARSGRLRECLIREVTITCFQLENRSAKFESFRLSLCLPISHLKEQSSVFAPDTG